MLALMVVLGNGSGGTGDGGGNRDRGTRKAAVSHTSGSARGGSCHVKVWIVSPQKGSVSLDEEGGGGPARLPYLA